ncbi:RNase H [Carpediemonas membranifera]|uniref:ribonuclease H n=1 Tax=Carpediemonas membranifera TaxID=201153 RepID=A0A8J6E9F5_9EUKA|nr:RNase H [Carpediemonas membranifera]|eukprot:KAG9393265.1 RNase H [Carpediemonas membranifera]
MGGRGGYRPKRANNPRHNRDEHDMHSRSSGFSVDHMLAQLSRADQLLALKLLQEYKSRHGQQPQLTNSAAPRGIPISDVWNTYASAQQQVQPRAAQEAPTVPNIPATLQQSAPLQPPPPQRINLQPRTAEYVQQAAKRGKVPEKALFNDFGFDNVIFTDGGSKPNPGPGGFGTIIMSMSESVIQVGKGFKFTTNNRMELRGVIHGLKRVNPHSNVAVLTDSMYVVDSINKGWLRSWRSRAWMPKDGKKIKNPDLWDKVLYYIDNHRGDLVFAHVKAHAGILGNEAVDKLATAARERANGREDRGYDAYAERGQLYCREYRPKRPFSADGMGAVTGHPEPPPQTGPASRAEGHADVLGVKPGPGSTGRGAAHQLGEEDSDVIEIEDLDDSFWE